jgi:hypothetical protein
MHSAGAVDVAGGKLYGVAERRPEFGKRAGERIEVADLSTSRVYQCVKSLGRNWDLDYPGCLNLDYPGCLYFPVDLTGYFYRPVDLAGYFYVPVDLAGYLYVPVDLAGYFDLDFLRNFNFLDDGFTAPASKQGQHKNDSHQHDCNTRPMQFDHSSSGSPNAA